MTWWIMLLIGAMCVVPLALVDPSAALMLFDLELLTAVGTAGLALRGDAHEVRERFLAHHTVVSLRAGWDMTRERPGSLLQA